jgi:D-alanine-D-alanine ligase
MRIAILSGGLNAERDVSLRSGRRVAEALREALPNAEVIEVDLNGEFLDSLGSQSDSGHDSFDVVIPLIHGVIGEDATLRSMLELKGIPFIGSGSSSAARSFDKGIASGLVPRGSAPKFVAFPQSFFREMGAPRILDTVIAGIGLPLVVKPISGGSALGVRLCTAAEHVAPALVDAFGYGDRVMLQRAVSGTELAVTVIDSGGKLMALPPVEIVPLSGVYDFDARYTAGATEFFVPSRLAPDVVERVGAYAVAVHESLGLRDISRTDVVVDSSGVIWFLEVNVSPGMTETSLVPQAIEAAGLSVGGVFAELVDQAVARVN